MQGEKGGKGGCGAAAPTAAPTEAPAGEKPVIITQPAKTTVAAGENATFTVEASGEGLTYQWQYSTDNGSTWKSKKGATSSSYTVTAKSSVNGILYRCKVKNSAGSVKSKSARLTVDGVKPRILTQPEAQSAAAGESVTFKVAAAGTGLTYQWQYSKDGGQTWHNKKGAASASYKVKAKAEYDGILYRCRVSNTVGKAYSESAQLTVK